MILDKQAIIKNDQAICFSKGWCILSHILEDMDLIISLDKKTNSFLDHRDPKII